MKVQERMERKREEGEGGLTIGEKGEEVKVMPVPSL